MRAKEGREYLIVELIIDKFSFEVENALADHVPKDMVIVLLLRLLASCKVSHIPAVIAGKITAAVLAELYLSPRSAGSQRAIDGENREGYTLLHV